MKHAHNLLVDNIIPQAFHSIWFLAASGIRNNLTVITNQKSLLIVRYACALGILGVPCSLYDLK